jgi:hypothetical protein
MNYTVDKMYIGLEDTFATTVPSDKWVKRARKLRSRRWQVVNKKIMKQVHSKW